MQYHALACDFDGAMAWDGQVDPSTVDPLIRLRESGRKLVLVTGRPLKDLADHLPDLDMVDRLVGENGAVSHLKRHDYSNWFADSVGAMDLASEVVEIEASPVLNARESRTLVRSAIEREFALPA
jgi:hydroxymethylpyrimidine pyrophosphatase-like HAD family hydrolase